MKAAMLRRAVQLVAAGPRRFASALRRRLRILAAPDWRFGTDGMALAPAVVVVEITHRCNLGCSMCDLYGTGAGIESLRAECASDERALSTADLARLFRELRQARPAIIICGGEPLLRPDISEVVAEAVAHGLPVALVTNGTLLAGHTPSRLWKQGWRRWSFRSTVPVPCTTQSAACREASTRCVRASGPSPAQRPRAASDNPWCG